MNDEFKKLSQGDVTRYVLENASSGGTSSGSVASVSMPVGGTRKRGDNLITQEADKKTEPPKTRNPVAKNASAAIGGGAAGAHKDKKKAAKQGQEKHKKPYMEALQARLDQLKSKVAEGSLNELSKDTLKSYSKERGATIHADQRDAGGARTMAADKKKHGDTRAAADWDDEASWLDKRAEKGAKGVAQATTKIAKKGVSEGSLNELSSDLLKRSAQAATDKRNQAMDPELHNALGGGYMNPLATHYDNVSQKMDNRAAQVRKKETIQKIASKIASPAVMRKMGMSDMEEGVAEEFNGEYDDEAGMAQSNLLTTARAVMGLLKTIKDRDNLPEWGQEKIAKAEMMLVSVWDYLQSQKAMGNDPQQGVAEGFVPINTFKMPTDPASKPEKVERDYTPKYDPKVHGPVHDLDWQRQQNEKRMYNVVRHSDRKVLNPEPIKGQTAAEEFMKQNGLGLGNADLEQVSTLRFHVTGIDASGERVWSDPLPDMKDVDNFYKQHGIDKFARTTSVTNSGGGSLAEGKADYNFDIEDLKRLERIRDLATMKAQAMALISKPSAKPMKPEKVEWFKNALERMNSPLKVIKMMYDLMLSGEGHSVIGTKSSMNPNNYRQRFGEQGVDESWKSKLGGAALAGALALGASGAHADMKDVPAGGHNQLPDIVAHVTFKVGEKTVTKDINLGSYYRSPKEAAEELKNFLNSKGITSYKFDLERVKPTNNYLDNSPATGTGNEKPSIDTKEPSSNGKNTGDYMAKEDAYMESLENMLERSVSQAQHNLMVGVANNPQFAQQVKVKQKVGQEFANADVGHDISKLPIRVPKKK